MALGEGFLGQDVLNLLCFSMKSFFLQNSNGNFVFKFVFLPFEGVHACAFLYGFLTGNLYLFCLSTFLTRNLYIFLL